MNISEALRAEDLEYLVKNVFEIDSYKSKIGDDEDICVLSFTVDKEEPAKDLENFIERGFSFILDADVSAGELDDGKYRVYVEIERSRHLPEQIVEVIESIKMVTGEKDFRFRYFKGFKSHEATLENLQATVPTDKKSYDQATADHRQDNADQFFNNSNTDQLSVVGESITFKKTYGGPISFDIVSSGPKQEVYKNIAGPIMMESSSMAEVMFLTKYIGNYNITKISDTFIFENSGWAVALKRK